MISNINFIFNGNTQSNRRKNTYTQVYFTDLSFKGNIKFQIVPLNKENNKILAEIIHGLKERSLITHEKNTTRYKYLAYDDNNSSAFDKLRDFLQKYKIKFIEKKDENFSLYMNNVAVRKSIPQVINTKKKLKQMNLMKAGKIKPVNFMQNDLKFPSKAELWNKFIDNLNLPENSYLLYKNGEIDNRIKVLKHLYESWSPNKDVIAGLKQDEIAKAIGSNYPVISKTLKILKEQNLIECFRNKNNSYDYKIASRFFEIATGDKKFNTAKFQFSTKDLNSDQLNILNSKIGEYKNKKIITSITENNDLINIEFDHNTAFKNEETFELKPLIELISRFNANATLSIPSRHIKTNFQLPEGILVKSNPDNEMIETSKSFIFSNSHVSIVNTPEFVRKNKLKPSEHIILKGLLHNLKNKSIILTTQRVLIKELDLTETILRNGLKGLEDKGILEKRKKNSQYIEFTQEFLKLINTESPLNKSENIFVNISYSDESVEALT